jgi:hypothetical protein
MSLVLSRVRWAKKMNQFSMLVEGLPNVWFTSLNISKQDVAGSRRGAPSKIIYSLSYQGSSLIPNGSDGFTVIAELLNHMKKVPDDPAIEHFYDQITELKVPNWNRVEDTEKGVNLVTFPLTMKMDPTFNRRAPEEKTAANNKPRKASSKRQ